jgi:outer membrane protein assembly factor BamE (lipoprotein component of BamABCDE complex)
VQFSYLAVCSVLVLVGIANANGQNQTSKAKVAKFHAEEVQQPLYREYRGVRLGMTADETRAILGSPVLKSDDLDYYVISTDTYEQLHVAQSWSELYV